MRRIGALLCLGYFQMHYVGERFEPNASIRGGKKKQRYHREQIHAEPSALAQYCDMHMRTGKYNARLINDVILYSYILHYKHYANSTILLPRCVYRYIQYI